MFKLFNKQSEDSTFYLETNMKDYRFLGDEADILGQRLDACRKALAESKTIWAQKHWQQQLDCLLFQWRQLPILADGRVTFADVPRWTVSHDFWEGDDGSGRGLTNRVFNSMSKDASLDASWEREIQRRLLKGSY